MLRSSSDGTVSKPEVWDVSGLQPQARSIAGQVAQVCVDKLGDDLVTLLFHGSVVKGGIIEGSSDVDFAMIVRPEILTPGNELPIERAIALHRRLATIDPAPFRYLQGLVCSPQRPPGVGFIPGGYAVAIGSANVPLATSQQLLAGAADALASLSPQERRDRLSNALLNHGEDRLYREVRWLCTDVWPILFHLACLVEGDGVKAWQRSKFENAALLAADPIVGPPLGHWLDAVTSHYATGESTDSALKAIAAGLGFLEAASAWNAQRLAGNTGAGFSHA